MIEARHITKRYHAAAAAVNDVTFTAADGSVTGLLGPNGAGKSTTLNILAGCLAPSSGEALLDGHDVFEEPEAAKRTLGYLPEQPPLYPEMTPEEYLLFVAALRGVPKKARAGEVERVMELAGVTDMRRRLIRQLSKGCCQRVGVAQALVGDPKNILLDEPTGGLDPKQLIHMRSLIRSLGGAHTVILSSHILSEVQAVCDRVLILSGGALAAGGTQAELGERVRGKTVLRLTVRGRQRDVERVLRQLAGGDGFVAVEEDGVVRAELHADGPDAREKAFFAFGKKGLPILEMTSEKTTLEDVFLECTGQGEDGGGQA